MRYLITALLLILPACSKEKNIDLKYGQKVTLKHNFYGTLCCTVISKENDFIYYLTCRSASDARFLRVPNGVDGVITPGCKN